MLNRLRRTLGRVVPNGIKYTLKFKLLPQLAYFYPETIIVSYPKCGRSWLRLIINDSISHNASLSEEDKLQEDYLHKMDPRISSIGVTHDDGPMLKTPEEILENKRFYKNKKVVFLVRDPRDIVISWYFQVVNRGSIKNFKRGIKCDSPSDFIHNERGGLKSIIKFYNIWWEKKEIPRSFYVLKYEALRTDTFSEVKKLFEFWGIIDVMSDESINYAIEKNSFDKLKKKEEKGTIKHDAFRTINVDNSEAYKVRKGKVGGYKDYLSAGDIEQMDKLIRETLHESYKY